MKIRVTLKVGIITEVFDDYPTFKSALLKYIPPCETRATLISHYDKIAYELYNKDMDKNWNISSFNGFMVLFECNREREDNINYGNK